MFTCKRTINAPNSDHARVNFSNTSLHCSPSYLPEFKQIEITHVYETVKNCEIKVTKALSKN